MVRGNAIYVAIFIVAILAIVYLFNSKNTLDKNMDDNIKENVTENVDITTNKEVTLVTNQGKIELEIFLKESPVTAGNFIKLAEEGFYDGTRFHRVISNFMIQGGDPLSKSVSNKEMWGTGGPGYSIDDEFVEGLSNIRGAIAMANSGPNSGGSQFFINLVDNINLDWNRQPLSSKHPVFGKVISGMDVVEKIGGVEKDVKDRPIEDAIIEKVIVE